MSSLDWGRRGACGFVLRRGGVGGRQGRSGGKGGRRRRCGGPLRENKSERRCCPAWLVPGVCGTLSDLRQGCLLSRKTTELPIHTPLHPRMQPSSHLMWVRSLLPLGCGARATCDDTRHFSYWIRPGGSWHPEYLTLDHLPLVRLVQVLHAFVFDVLMFLCAHPSSDVFARRMSRQGVKCFEVGEGR